MGACASTQQAAEAAVLHKTSVNGTAPEGPLPSKTPVATAPAHGPQEPKANGAATANYTQNGGPDLVASAPTSGNDKPGVGNGDAVASASVSHTPETPPPVPSVPASEPEPAEVSSSPHATANGTAAPPNEIASTKEYTAAPPIDLQATAIRAVLAGGAYHSNKSGPPRPACQQERLTTVEDIRDTLKQAHDPAIGEGTRRQSVNCAMRSMQTKEQRETKVAGNDA